ncbi:MAG: GNAT family N-acetyltransferase [Lachnospiraceae bacterium]|nr:GNAT family N-acetyltransferase [Lachnospiraceae bacterium]
MEISVCNEADIIAAGAFYDRVVKYLCEHINYPKWRYKDYPSEQSVRAMTQEGGQFICKDGDTIIGAFVLNDDPQGKYENAIWSRMLMPGEYMVCHALAIEPTLQGLGLGKQVVEFCKVYAKEHGYKAIRLDAVPDNAPAKRLYEKCGFQYVGDADLERNIAEIPLFSMYEMNIQ